MGIPLLTFQIENVNARLPLPSVESYYDDDDNNEFINDDCYRNLGNRGKLNSVGIDGAIFLHGHITQKYNEDGQLINNDFEAMADEVVGCIIYYVKKVCSFFSMYTTTTTSNMVTCYFVVDGPSPVIKNRSKYRNNNDNNNNNDLYSKMSLDERDQLHSNVINLLKMRLDTQIPFYNFDLKSNYEVEYEKRGEGELELIRYAAKNLHSDTTDVIISTDTDVTAAVILRGLKNIVIVTPKLRKGTTGTTGPYMSNLYSLSRGLGLNNEQLIQYVILHFLFFGSDYNYGLINCATPKKKSILYNACLQSSHLLMINNMKALRRPRRPSQKIFNFPMDALKNLLIVECLCSIFYYLTLGERRDILTEFSPLLYQNRQKWDLTTFVASINFDEDQIKFLTNVISQSSYSKSS